jgi:NAD(P)-dependent dehydrogenase (short-subunit alcohol dehydrogenase family)
MIDVNNYQPEKNLLADRVVLVTGAGDGIGRIAARTYAEYGARVILLGRTIANLEQVHDEIESLGLAQPGIYPLDLEGATHDHYLQMAAVIEKEYGRLDGLLHNASILGDRLPLEHYSPDTWLQVMQVNLNGPFLMTRALLPLLRQAADAAIIFTSSGVGQKPRANWGAYSVSKYALEGMSLIFSQELENISAIRVNALNPGATRTRMRAAAFPAENPSTLKTAEDLMPLYLYLMGPDSRNITGQSLNAQ